MDNLDKLDREQLLELLDKLEDLKVHPAFRLLQARLEALLSRDRQLLVSEDQILLVRLLQGRVRAEEEILGLPDDVAKDLQLRVEEAKQ